MKQERRKVRQMFRMKEKSVPVDVYLLKGGKNPEA